MLYRIKEKKVFENKNMQHRDKKLKLSRQCGSLCINMKEKCKFSFVFYGHKLCKVNCIHRKHPGDTEV